MARRAKSFHHNLQEGENVVFHREHRSKRGRTKGYRDKRAFKILKKEKEWKILNKEFRNLTED